MMLRDNTPSVNRKRQRTLFESAEEESQKRTQVPESKNTPSSISTPAAGLNPEEDASTPEGDEDYTDDSLTSAHTELEDALPPVKVDQETIQNYETLGSFPLAEPESPDARQRYDERKWVKGRSSIYVDAFNLALESVLGDEAHLFDEAERALFDYWRGLCYDSQYLYVLCLCPDSFLCMIQRDTSPGAVTIVALYR